MPQAGPRSYYVDRAITRKIVKDGTGLRPEKMATQALWRRVHAHSMTVCERLLDGNVSSPPLARAAIELLDCLQELEMRGVQLTLPISGPEVL